MKHLKSNLKLTESTRNIAVLLRDNALRFVDHPVFREKIDGEFHSLTWAELYTKVNRIAGNLKTFGVSKGDKLLIYSPNRTEMLLIELAVMAMGAIAVPVFAWFKKEAVELLINHSDAKFLTVAGQTQLDRLSENLSASSIFVFDKNVDGKRFKNLHTFDELVSRSLFGSHLDFDLKPDEICLNMYTSGTMGTPKCVQLTHRNILSQQAALKQLWNLSQEDRFLSYLPWHHSFGGIFEMFSALSSGATMTLEPSYGKSPESILENWKEVMPTVFFSVPKIYGALFDLIQKDPASEKALFHPQLKFVFTAAAPLPQKLSDEFESRGIPVLEGWGLTETSPCCTLTDPTLKREAGVVGMPLPGVEIRIDEENEIVVKGPNVMTGYYNNDVANANAFTIDRWFKTGDVGEITETGLKLVTRKDRIFKLSNGEKVIPTDLEKAIESRCHFIQYAVVAGSGKDYPVALIFPNKQLLEDPDYELSENKECECPHSLGELSRCFKGCLTLANHSIGQKFAIAKSAAIIDDELSMDNSTLTPSMKVAPKNVLDRYKSHLENLYGKNIPVSEEVYVVELEPVKQNSNV